MTHAVFTTGGKQYLAKAGDKLRIEKLPGSLKEGDTLTFDSVLMKMGDTLSLGTPFVKGATVSAKVTKVGRAAKVTVIKYLQKSRYFKKNGHRQPFVEIQIDSVK